MFMIYNFSIMKLLFHIIIVTYIPRTVACTCLSLFGRKIYQASTVHHGIGIGKLINKYIS